MPNWIEGTVKVRGDYENVKRFFTEGVELRVRTPVNRKTGESSVSYSGPKSDWMDIHEVVEDDGERSARITCKAESGTYLYIKETARAFPPEFMNWEVKIINPANEKDAIAIADIQQAWSWTAEDWIALSKKYNVDFRLHGWEQGMQFESMIEVLRDGTVTEDSHGYDNWLWECPFPFMGG